MDHRPLLPSFNPPIHRGTVARNRVAWREVQVLCERVHLMSKRPAVVLLALLLCSLAGPMVVSAEQSGSIEASASTVTLQPSNAFCG